jgi:hypothetical protein
MYGEIVTTSTERSTTATTKPTMRRCPVLNIPIPTPTLPPARGDDQASAPRGSGLGRFRKTSENPPHF